MFATVIAAASERDSGGFVPRQPGIGLMVWTLVLFGLVFFILRKPAFPRIAEALDRRQKAIEESIDAAERTRTRGRRSCSPSTASG